MASPNSSSTTVSEKKLEDPFAIPHSDGKVYYEVEIDGGDTSPVDSEKSSPQNANSLSDPSQFPDGGWKAWLVVFGGWCALFCSFGWINCIGVFQNYYESNQLREYDPSTIAWISSLETFMMFFGGPFVGKIYDNYGARYPTAIGTFFLVFGIMMTSLSSQYYQFILAQGICSALGASFVFYPAVTSVGTWFWKNRAFAYGVVASGSSFGGVIFPILVQRTIPQVGFGWSMRITAFLILALMIVACVTVKSRVPPRPRPLEIMEFIHPMQEPVYSINLVGSFLFFICMFIPINFVIVQARAEGMSASLAEYLVPILNAGSMFGRILPGWIADRVGRFNMMIFMTYFTSIFVLGLWLPSNSNATIITFAAFYGFGTGAFVSLAPALIAQITKDITKLGVRTGTMFAVIAVAALIGNPIAGALVTAWNGEFTGLQIFCGVVQFGGATVFVIARIFAGGWSLKTVV